MGSKILRDRLSCVGRAGVETGPGVEYPGTVAGNEAGNIPEHQTEEDHSLFSLYLPCTVGKSVEQILILDIQVLHEKELNF